MSSAVLPGAVLVFAALGIAIACCSRRTLVIGAIIAVAVIAWTMLPSPAVG